MHFTVTAVPADRFAGWVAGDAKRGGATLDAAAYRTLGRQGTLPAPVTYASVAPTLFADIVAQRLAPTAGPPLVTPGTTEPKPKDARP